MKIIIYDAKIINKMIIASFILFYRFLSVFDEQWC